jgi:hypothetical protein
VRQPKRMEGRKHVLSRGGGRGVCVCRTRPPIGHQHGCHEARSSNLVHLDLQAVPKESTPGVWVRESQRATAL